MSKVEEAGKIRRLPQGTPGLPPTAPYVNGQYAIDQACAVDLWRSEHPDLFTEEADNIVGYWCTRLPHPASEVHVSGDSAHGEVVVWGGE